MQETILDGKAKGQEITYGYTKEVNGSVKPRTGKKLSAVYLIQSLHLGETLPSARLPWP